MLPQNTSQYLKLLKWFLRLQNWGVQAWKRSLRWCGSKSTSAPNIEAITSCYMLLPRCQMPKIDRSQEQGYFGFPLHWKQAVLQKGGIRTQPSQCSQLGQRSQLLSFRRPILPKYLFCTNWIRTPDFQAQLSHFFREHQRSRQETSYSRTNAFNSRALNFEKPRISTFSNLELALWGHQSKDFSHQKPWLEQLANGRALGPCEVVFGIDQIWT